MPQLRGRSRVWKHWAAQELQRIKGDFRINMRNILKLIALTVVITLPVVAQQPSESSHVLTAADYARAEKWMGYNTNPLVYRSGIRPTWQADDRFWYRLITAEGSEFVMFDPASGTRTPAFDHVKLATALSAGSGTSFDAHHLPFTDFELSVDGQTVSFTAQRRRWKCDVSLSGFLQRRHLRIRQSRQSRIRRRLRRTVSGVADKGR
jgi:hypothetical protein